MRLALLPATALLAIAAPAQEPPQVVTIELSSFKFTPATVTLEHGRPYLLRFTNSSHGGHDYVAKAFFAAAPMGPAARAAVRRGEVELGGGESADVALIAPAPGRYEAHCSHFMHATFGMKGEIIVR